MSPNILGALKVNKLFRNMLGNQLLNQQLTFSDWHMTTRNHGGGMGPSAMVLTVGAGLQIIHHDIKVIAPPHFVLVSEDGDQKTNTQIRHNVYRSTVVHRVACDA
jgi:hypothetical protein